MSEITSANSSQDLISQIYAKAASMGLSQEQAQALIIALAISSSENTAEFIGKLYDISEGDLNTVLKSVNSNQADYKNNISVIKHLEHKSETSDYGYNDIISLLEKYLYTSDIPVNVLLSNLENILKSDIYDLLTNMDASAINIVSIEDFKTYLENKNIYSKTELERIFALLKGMLLASKATEEAGISATDSTKAPHDTDIEKNKWMILYISIAGILLGLIIIYFNRRRDNANKKSDK